MKDLIFFDLETTGLDKDVHTILEAAVVRTDWEGKTIKDQWVTKIKPTPMDLEKAEPKALEINGYAKNPEAWDDAPSMEEVLSELRIKVRGGILAGHNVVGFDVPFLRAIFLRYGIKDKISYHVLDTTSLAIEHLMPCGLKSISLVNIRKALSIETGTAHTALADTLACLEIYRKLARSYWWERAFWKHRLSQQ